MLNRIFLRTLVVVASLLAIACGSDAVIPATTSPPPTPLLEFETGVVAPSDLDSTQFDLISDTPQRAFPPELEPDSEPLPEDRVIELWTQFLSGTIHLDNVELAGVFETCTGGSGTFLIEHEPNPWAAGDPMEWWIDKPPGTRWNAVYFNFTNEELYGDGYINVPLTRTDGKVIGIGGVQGSLSGSVGGILLESPNCD